MSDMLSASEIAVMCGVSVETIRRWHRKRVMPEGVLFTRRCRRWKRAEIAEWIARGMTEGNI